ncbi:MAG TPA: phosphonate ABC transporter, permease protein PhnE [Armatimonadota bacterium]|nr:phosphonate ABC transporter, permease protein PhnE [Armatimonadota bacterium]
MTIIPQPKNRRRVLISSLLSIIPGLGQIYLGEVQRGLVLLFGLPAQTVIFWAIGGQWLAATTVIIWAWNILDARKLARGTKVSLAVPILLLVVLNLAAGWHVTKIDLYELATGVPNMRRIGVSLFQPQFVVRDVRASAVYTVPGPDVTKLGYRSEPASDAPNISVSPDSVVKGQNVTVSGRKFPSNQNGVLRINVGSDWQKISIKTDSNGRFISKFVNQSTEPGDYIVEAIIGLPFNQWHPSETLKLTSRLMLETIFLALVGTAMSIIVTVPLSFFGARNLMKTSRAGRIAYAATRGLFNVLRSIEVLIIAVMLTAAVGIGPFAGVLALAIHGIGALGKLYSEAIESIEQGPIEAITATGASKLQVIAFAVVPQIIPQFISFTMYRWDINVRMATVIGLVGGGGIGYILMQYIGLLQWKEAATAIWLIAAVVMSMDYASAVIREKLL